MTKWSLEAAGAFLSFADGYRGGGGDGIGSMFDQEGWMAEDTRATGRFRGQKGIIIVF